MATRLLPSASLSSYSSPLATWLIWSCTLFFHVPPYYGTTPPPPCVGSTSFSSLFHLPAYWLRSPVLQGSLRFHCLIGGQIFLFFEDSFLPEVPFIFPIFLFFLYPTTFPRRVIISLANGQFSPSSHTSGVLCLIPPFPYSRTPSSPA